MRSRSTSNEPASAESEAATQPSRRSKRSQHWFARGFRKHVRPIFSRPLSRFAAFAVPYLYLGYMRFVWATSRIVGGDEFTELNRMAERHDGAVALLWHEEVMTVAFGYPYVGVRGHTLASVGESGEVIARMLRLCGYVVFRGGSSSGTARRREGVLLEMIEHMQTNREVIYGLTVDGSRGPAYRMKTGGIVIARECGKPIALVRTWYKRCLRLPTWDRMAVPLPFNVIRYYIRGPYHVPESARTHEGLAEFRLRLERDLIDLAAKSYDDMGQPRPKALVARDVESLDGITAPA
jgi:lysophospholipid acyltransferase (LPLAT)-like uncharacterized protein